MTNLLLDLKYAWRTLLKTPGFTIVAIVTLALGIGANTAIFSVIESVLLRNLPYNHAEKLVMLWGDAGAGSNRRGQVSFTDVEDWRRSSPAFEDIAAFSHWSAVLNTGDRSESVPAIQVSDAFFHVMRAKPLLGRLFIPADNLFVERDPRDPFPAGQLQGNDFVIVISYGIWQERFGGDPNVIGRIVHINALPYAVVGVLPRDFASLPSTLVGGNTGIYRPCAEGYDSNKRDNRHFRAIGRLRDSASLTESQAQLTGIAARLASAYPKSNARYGIRVTSLHEDLVGKIRPALLMLYGGVVFVLLIACSNLASLLLARFARRDRELAVRSALGASQWRLVRQLVTESLLLALAGGALGILCGSWLISSAQNVAAASFPALGKIELNAPVLMASAIVSLLAGLCFGLLPAWYSSRGGLAAALKSGSATNVGGSHAGLRNALVIAEVSLALVLLTASGLLVRTIQALNHVDPGFQADNIVSADVTLPWVRYGQKPTSIALYDQLLDRLRTTPGVSSAEAVSILPMTDFDTVGFKVENKTPVDQREPESDRYVVSPHYLQTMGIALKAGRYLDERDDSRSPSVVVVNETFAKRVWPDEKALGKRIQLPPFDEHSSWLTVVGIVGDVKQYGLDHASTMQFYAPYRQLPWNYMTLVLKTNAAPSDLISTVRREVRTLEADAAVSDPQTMSQILADSIESRKLTTILLTAFSGLALLLSSLGIYGVLSYLVSQRTREIGLRMALGASQSNVRAMVLKKGLPLVVAGLAIGVTVSILAGRLMASQLFGVQPHDGLTFGAVILLLTLVATLASYIPARRATTIDPMEALRQD